MKDLITYPLMGLILIAVFIYNEWKVRKQKTRQHIIDALTKIQHQTGCSRVTIFEYRKGQKSKFITCRFEVTDKTTSSLLMDFNKMEIFPYIDLINKINDSKVGWIKVIDEGEDKEVNKISKYWGTVTAYNFKITKSVWDGAISLTWVNNKIDLTEGQVQGVEIVIMGIQSLIKKA